ncbi:MAG: DNA mismatch repair protein MutL, partial [Planctomycetes bacterium]|nr:DNA mismatch repair protein MutL [Planctomycetota bacterium]
MDVEDAKCCFFRYATSKLNKIEDLRSISTFGFRGEALASIASVSKVRLTTRQNSQECATQVDVEGGQIIKTTEAGAPFGTRIDVSDLFYNVPARRKFLKTPRSEAALIERVIKNAVLLNPSVGFSL